MHVILAVAVDAQVAGPAHRPVVAMAPFACDFRVCTVEREVAHIVQRPNIRKRFRGMALFACGAVLALMNVGLWVTAKAIHRARLERF